MRGTQHHACRRAPHAPVARGHRHKCHCKAKQGSTRRRGADPFSSLRPKRGHAHRLIAVEVEQRTGGHYMGVTPMSRAATHTRTTQGSIGPTHCVATFSISLLRPMELLTLPTKQLGLASYCPPSATCRRSLPRQIHRHGRHELV